MFARFFALPEEAKMKYHVPGSGGARGYTPFGVETAKDSKHADLKEFWHIGREIPRDSKYADVMPPNVWPDEVPGFREHGYGAVRGARPARFARAVARWRCTSTCRSITSTTRPTSAIRSCARSTTRRSPPTTSPTCAPARTRTSTSSRCWSAPAPPVWKCKSRQGEWVPFTAEADTIVVNIGDMLQRLTNHVYPSTTHRVVNPPGEQARKPRYSVPFFLHPESGFPDRRAAVDGHADNPEPLSGADHRAGLPRRATARDQAEVVAERFRSEPISRQKILRPHPSESWDPS